MNTTKDTFYFCGVGGAGMSPLARLLAFQGKRVLGSDRSYDSGRNLPFFEKLKSEGIELVPQDGSKVDQSISSFVYTRAVENSIPDIARAQELGLRFVKRPQLMAEMFAQTKNIAVAGTSGKSTTTGMIGHIMSMVGCDPTVMNGAVMLNTGTNFRFGKSEYTVFEADESDGYEDVIIVCPADIAVLTNISLDHFEVDELKGMFSRFLAQSKTGAVINADCAISRSIQGAAKQVVTFGGSADAEFSLARYPVELEIPGAHNALNALAALAACSLRGIDPKEGIAALRSFKGISRRLEIVGRARGVTVYDDFASNPGKISASLGTVISSHRRVFAVFQPHGFQPTKMMKDGYIETFSRVLRTDDQLLMPDIYYVGGTTNLINGQAVALPKDISSRDVIDGVKNNGRCAQYLPTRDQIIEYLQSVAGSGDAVVVMGSRDETLPEFSRAIAAALAE